MGEVVEIGQELGTKEHISMGLEHIASSLAYMTRFDEAYEKALEGLEAARAIGDREHEAGVLAFSLPFAYVRKGDFDTARRLLSEGLEISTKIGSTVNHIISAYLLSVLASWQGDYEGALRYGLNSLKAALPSEDYMPFMLIPPLGVLGMIYLEINEKFTDKIAEFHMHALRLLESPTARMTGGTAWADLGHCAIALGDLQTAEEVLQKGLNYPNMFIYLERPRNLAGAALLASVKGDSREATRLAEEARGYAQERGMRHLYPLTDLIRGKVLVAAGEIDRGLDVLEQAEAEALELGMRPVVWQARAAAANILEESGRREEAAEKRIGARSMALEIADLFKDQDLRAAYLENVSVKLGEAL
jgi:tetratricopeptide (TPR) repeat protein